jgi:hypothetical protein
MRLPTATRGASRDRADALLARTMSHVTGTTGLFALGAYLVVT